MYKKSKVILLCIISAFLLTGCVTKSSEETTVKLTKPLSDNEYRIVVNDGNTNADVIHEQNQLQSLMGVQLGTSNSVDVYDFEKGLTDISKEYYSPKDYYFQKATFLRYNTVRNWLQRKMTEKDAKEKKLQDPTFVDTGLNPSNDEVITAEDGSTFAPYYLSYIYGQNYVQSEGGDLKVKGITIGLALNSSQKYISKDTSEKIHVFSTEELTKFSQDAAAKIVNNIRQQDAFRNVPIVLSVYQTNSATNFVAGGYFLKSFAKASESLGNFTGINQKTVLVINRGSIDQTVRSIDDTFASNFLEFQQSIQTTYPSVTGISATAKITDNKISKIQMVINITTGSQMEVLAVKQYIERSQEQNFNTINFPIETLLQLHGNTRYVLLKQPGEKTGSLEL